MAQRRSEDEEYFERHIGALQAVIETAINDVMGDGFKCFGGTYVFANYSTFNQNIVFFGEEYTILAHVDDED